MNRIGRQVYFYGAILVLAFIVQLFANYGKAPEDPIKILKPAISGDPTSDHAGKPVLIYFWADWCGICTSMQGTISSILNDYRGVTIALKSGPAYKVTQYLQQTDLDWETVIDENGSMAAEFGVKGVPAIFFLGRDGSIKLSTAGYTTEFGIRLRLWVARYL